MNYLTLVQILQVLRMLVDIVIVWLVLSVALNMSERIPVPNRFSSGFLS